MIAFNASKATDVREGCNEGYHRGVRLAALLLFALSSVHAALLTESSYLVNPAGSQPGIAQPALEGPAQIPEDYPASENALSLTRPGYSLSINYGGQQSSGAAATDNTGAPIVPLITDMIRASHTFHSGVRESDAHILQASINLQANSNLSPLTTNRSA